MDIQFGQQRPQHAAQLRHILQRLVDETIRPGSQGDWPPLGAARHAQHRRRPAHRLHKLADQHLYSAIGKAKVDQGDIGAIYL